MAKRALVVGIDDYQDPRNYLPSCDEDAHHFESLLRGDPYGFSDVTVFNDSQATLANVVDALKQMFQATKPNDVVVFFFSGHGYSAPKDDVLRDYVVLYDGFLSDDQLEELTQLLPDGALFTIVLDSCFSGGIEKRIFSLVNDQRTKVKFWQAPQNVQTLNLEAEDSLQSVRIFGSAPVEVSTSLGVKEFQKQVQSDPTNDLQFKGLLLAACLATETAAASTLQTNGMSAFTYCFLDSLNTKGSNAPVSVVMQATQEKLRSLGFGQTPTIKQPKSGPDRASRPFLLVQDAQTASNGTTAAASNGSTTEASNSTTAAASNSTTAAASNGTTAAASNGTIPLDGNDLVELTTIIATLMNMHGKSSRPFAGDPWFNPGLPDVSGISTEAGPTAVNPNPGGTHRFWDHFGFQPPIAPGDTMSNGAPTMNRMTTEKRWTDYVEPALAILASLKGSGDGAAGKDIWSDAANSISREVRRGAESLKPEDLVAAANIIAALNKGTASPPQADLPSDPKRWTDFVQPALAIFQILKGANGGKGFRFAQGVSTPFFSSSTTFDVKQFRAQVEPIIGLAKSLAEADSGNGKDFWPRLQPTGLPTWIISDPIEPVVSLAKKLAEADGSTSKDFWSHAANSIAGSVTAGDLITAAALIAAA